MMGQGDKKIRIRRTNEQLDKEVISEFEIPYIIMANLKGDYTVVELDELLPFRFGAHSM